MRRRIPARPGNGSPAPRRGSCSAPGPRPSSSSMPAAASTATTCAAPPSGSIPRTGWRRCPGSRCWSAPRGAEIGLATRILPGLELRLAAFVLTLGSEILFLGDAGTTEPSRASRRLGIEWTNRYQAASLARLRPRYRGDPGPLHRGRSRRALYPGAPNLVARGRRHAGRRPRLVRRRAAALFRRPPADRGQ